MDRADLERLSKEELIEILMQMLPFKIKIEELEKKIKELEAEQIRLTNELRKYHNENTPSSSIPYYEKGDEHHRHKQSGQKEGHTGMSRKKPNKIDRIVFLPLGLSPCCHAPVRKISGKPKKRIVTRLIPPRLENVEYLKERGICTDCGKEVQAEVPNTLPNCRFDLYFMILMSVLSVGMNMPFGKIRELLKFLWSLDVSEATISNTLAKLGGFLGDDYRKLKWDIREEFVKYDDETGWRILGKGYWLWDFIGSKTAFYAIEASRGKKVVRKILGKRSNSVNVTDGLPSYDEHESEKQKCWAHLMRRFKPPVPFPFENNKAKEDFKKFKNSMKLVFKRAKSDKEKFGVSLKLRKKYEKKLGRIIAKKYTGMNAEKILVTVRNQQYELFTFLEFEEVEPTNNRAERGLKPPIIKRKISYQNRSLEHARNYVMQLSIMKTAELRGNEYSEVLKEIIQEQTLAGKF